MHIMINTNVPQKYGANAYNYHYECASQYLGAPIFTLRMKIYNLNVFITIQGKLPNSVQEYRNLQWLQWLQECFFKQHKCITLHDYLHLTSAIK
jgi:hypothetical protein